MSAAHGTSRSEPTLAGLRADMSGQLVWAPSSSSSRRFELRVLDETVATLTFDKEVGSLATGRAHGGAWTFKRAGFLQPRVTVREAGSEYDHVVFRPTWTGSGDVEFRGGLHVHWRPFGFSNSEWAFLRADERLLTFHWLPDTAALDARVEFSAAALTLPEAPVLLLLGWYLRVLAYLEAQHGGS
jgi:hypothetical protein